MTALRMFGLALIVVGGVLLYYGNSEKQGLKNQLTEVVTGEPTRDVTIFFVTGGASIAIGVLGLAFGGRRR